jgi:hypothetical protein
MAGQQMAVTDVDRAPAVEFRFSTQRLVMTQVGLLLAFGAASVAVSLAVGWPWWDALPYFALAFVISLVLSRWSDRREPLRLPLRVTDDGLEVTQSKGSNLTVDWSNVRHAYIHGRWLPYLVVKLASPHQTRPPLTLGRVAGPGPPRPSEIAISLAYMAPDRDVLRRELARRLPTAAA